LSCSVGFMVSGLRRPHQSLKCSPR
jgi:hypothetical protein